MSDSNDFVLLLHEVKYHPDSYLQKLCDRVEVTSIVNVHRKDELRRYQKPPLFDERYVVIFDDLKIFEENRAYISFKSMLVIVLVETRSQLEDAMFICKQYKIPYKIYVNEFDRGMASQLIQANATVPVSDEVIKAIIRQVGLSPLRLLVAVGVCEQMGYSKQVVDKYVDKWVYPDTRRLIECLLGVPQSTTAINACRKYLHLNRHWYKYIRQTLVDELDSLLQVFTDKIDGKLAGDKVYDYLDTNHITRARLMYALKLFDKVSIASVFGLREFLKKASLMEVALKLI